MNVNGFKKITGNKTKLGPQIQGSRAVGKMAKLKPHQLSDTKPGITDGGSILALHMNSVFELTLGTASKDKRQIKILMSRAITQTNTARNNGVI